MFVRNYQVTMIDEGQSIVRKMIVHMDSGLGNGRSSSETEKTIRGKTI